ncbi:GATA zinc finger domain-containing protein 14-like [Bradysia coprophila]|uniref:GATA zinc finger domain-containing protein 14-like n=1 Tax=Bradysia coprophila TaxID=38358 RepID=UPI00187DC1ED|nr:GATA zinc finger domain-containing protein 14-like [Bradysia coprophila]
MNFLFTVCAAFLTYYHQINHCDAIEFDLDAFMKNFEKSQSELKWIRDESHKSEGNEIELADSKESNLDDDDENSVDHWYNKYRKWECSTDHGNKESVLNGYCGVYEDSYPKQDQFFKSNNVNHVSANNPKTNFKDTNYELTGTGLLSNNFDAFHEEAEPEKFDLNDDMNLSPEEKQDLDEYNEQMIPNPNFYKINNEVHLNDQQISKDHDSLLSELGFSPSLSKYPSSADVVFDPIDNDYGMDNRVQAQDIKKKRNTRDFDKMTKTKVNKSSYTDLSDQDDTRKNNLQHEADYKLSKSEQESQNKAETNTYLESQREHGQSTQNKPEDQFLNEFNNGNEPQNEVQRNLKNMHASTHNEPEDQFQNEFTNGNEPQNEIQRNLKNTLASTHNAPEDQFESEFTNGNEPQNEIQSTFRNTHASYNNFKETLEPKPDLNKNLKHVEATNSKTNSFTKNQFPDLKSQKHLSRQGKTNQLANEINLKISNRMMSKGLGPSLPSQSVKYNANAYRHPLNVDVENQRWRDRRYENRNDFTDYIGKQRRLLQFDYDDSANFDPQQEKNLTPNDNDKQTTSNGQIPNSLVPEDNIKELEMAPDNSTNIQIGSITNTNQTEPNSTLQTGQKDSLKIQLESNTSNATKEPAVGDHGKIVKRSVSFGKSNVGQETKIQGISKNSSIRDLVSGKLPNQLIQAVFQLVKENSRLNKAIGSKLDMKILDNLELNSINLFKSKEKTEKMVKKLMTSITDLIDEQITHQTCISLPPDLQSFYDKVLYVRSINSRVNNMRILEKTNAVPNKNSTKRFARSTIPESDIHEKYKTVGKLLKQFGHLKLRDQVKIFDIKEFLQNHMQLLDDLKTLNSEFVRKSRSVDSKNKLDLEKGARQISRQYANLLKTTKLIKATSLTDMDRMDVISTY